MRNKRNFILLPVSFLLVIIIFTALTHESVALPNGSYADDSSSYDYNNDFAGHDWVANVSLTALLNDNATRWQWLNDRKLIYFVGTEAPDNSGVSMTLDGKSIIGFGDFSWHHIYIHQDGSVYEDDAALRAKSMGDLACVNLDEEKYDLAAFYLGAMTHYISDMAVFCHVAENYEPPYDTVNFDDNHTQLEGYIKTRTDEADDMEEFFKIFPFTIGSKKPYDAAVDLAWDTYNDSTHNYAHNAFWLYENFFSNWNNTFADRSTDTLEHQEYYNRIEANLNNATKACAAAMNYVLVNATVPYTPPLKINDDDDDNDFDFESINGYNLSILSGSLIAIITILIMRKKVHKR
ncbi:MAG: hypothetical protein ACFE8A_05445 [Candidatus Hodarchaeota archaeon]